MSRLMPAELVLLVTAGRRCPWQAAPGTSSAVVVKGRTFVVVVASRGALGVARSRRSLSRLMPTELALPVAAAAAACRAAGAVPGYMSRTMSDRGREQQMSTWPSDGASSGSGEYETAPDSSGVMHVWHTPVRQLHRLGTSQASARSRRLRQLAAKAWKFRCGRRLPAAQCLAVRAAGDRRQLPAPLPPDCRGPDTPT